MNRYEYLGDSYGFSFWMVLLLISLHLPGFTGWGDNLCSPVPEAGREKEPAPAALDFCYDQLNEIGERLKMLKIVQ